MRYLVLVLLVGCGHAAPVDCNETGCKAGKWCNPNTGVCVTPAGTGGGGGHASDSGGGTGGSAGGVGGGMSGSGGGGGGGVTSDIVAVRVLWDTRTCPNDCSDCFINPGIASPTADKPGINVLKTTLESWMAARYASCIAVQPNTALSQFTINCRYLCIERSEQCVTVTGPVDRKTFDCPLPYGVSGNTWTP